MTFFARPNLSDEQFKQLSGTTLTLSGQTRIANVIGLSILASGSTFVPIVVTGGTNFDVLTYYNGQIVLKVPSSGASTGYYTCRTPSTCTVGGLVAGTTLTGKTIACILEEILVPVKPPVIVEPSISSFTIIPSTIIYEIGCSISITSCMCFSRGSVTPQYCGASPYRSGLPNTYKYQNFDGSYCCSASTFLSGSHSMSRSVTCGNNVTCGSVCYDAECTSAYDSTGGTTFCAPNPLPAGVTSISSATICGILPWYWGTKATNCVCGCDVANGTCKCVGLATGVLPIIYNSSPTDYLWFAVPNGTPVKTCWYVNGTNNGCIGGVSNLFAASCPQTVTSCQGCWAGCTYMVYVSCTQTGTAAGVPMCMY
jgi:hypothetical protein